MSRFLCACLVFGGVASAAYAAGDPKPKAGARLYVTNETSGDLSVIDMATNAVVLTLPVGKRPRGIQRSPDGRTLYVALSGSAPARPGAPTGGAAAPGDDKAQDAIGVVDAATNRVVGKLPGGSDPEQFAVALDGKRLFISNEDRATLSVVNVVEKRLEGSIPVGKEPEGVGISPDGRWVYVTCEASNSLWVIDAGTGKLLKQLQVGERPRSIAFLPDSTFAYVSLEQAGAVAVVALPKHEVVATIALGDPKLKPMGLAVSRDGATVFATTGRGGTVVRIATATNKVTGSTAVGERPWGVALSLDGTTLYTANGPSNDVSVVDVGTFRETARIKVGTRPWGLAVGAAAP